MSAIDEFLANNETYASGFSKGSIPMPPAKQIAVVACMDGQQDDNNMVTNYVVRSAALHHSTDDCG